MSKTETTLAERMSAAHIIAAVVASYKPSGQPLTVALEIVGALKEAGFRIVKVEGVENAG